MASLFGMEQWGGLWADMRRHTIDRISRDPIGEGRGLNLYGFVKSCPVNKIDVIRLL